MQLIKTGTGYQVIPESSWDIDKLEDLVGIVDIIKSGNCACTELLQDDQNPDNHTQVYNETVIFKLKDDSPVTITVTSEMVKAAKDSLMKDRVPCTSDQSDSFDMKYIYDFPISNEFNNYLINLMSKSDSKRLSKETDLSESGLSEDILSEPLMVSTSTILKEPS